MSIIFRKWRASDISAIAALMASHPLWQHYGVTISSATTRLNALFTAHEWGIVAQAQEEGLVGFVLYNAHTFGDSGYIRLIGAAPGMTGHGIGEGLLHEVEQDLSSRHVKRLVLLCTDWNHGARRFYERHGFTEVGALPNWVQAGTTEVIYAKHLESLEITSD